MQEREVKEDWLKGMQNRFKKIKIHDARTTVSRSELNLVQGHANTFLETWSDSQTCFQNRKTHAQEVKKDMHSDVGQSKRVA